MTPEAQRIAIAEACGWRFTDNPVSYGRCAWPKGAHCIDDWVPVDCIPDYLNDLNVMIGEAGAYAKKEGMTFSMCLINGRWGVGFYRHRHSGAGGVDEIAHKYGTELCPAISEVFLRAIGKWSVSDIS
jgi:hypothetical protein